MKFGLSLAWCDYGSIPPWTTLELHSFTPAVKESRVQNTHGGKVGDQ